MFPILSRKHMNYKNELPAQKNPTLFIFTLKSSSMRGAKCGSLIFRNLFWRLLPKAIWSIFVNFLVQRKRILSVLSEWRVTLFTFNRQWSSLGTALLEKFQIGTLKKFRSFFDFTTCLSNYFCAQTLTLQYYEGSFRYESVSLVFDTVVAYKSERTMIMPNVLFS